MTRVNIQMRLLALLSIGMLSVIGCTSGESGSKYEEPYPVQDISGVWWGFLGNGFVVGIITSEDQKEYYAQIVGSGIQYISLSSAPLVQEENTAIFLGYLDDYTWSQEGGDYQSVSETLRIIGSASTRSVFGGLPFGAYTYGSKDETGPFELYYNTTFDIEPDVNNLSGQWELSDSYTDGNTLVFSIASSDNKDSTTISATDDNGNTFTGTIEIHYSPIDETPHNLYDVSLVLNNQVDLHGLATYVLEASTYGLDISNKTLVIGATDSNKRYSLHGLAVKK